MPLSRLGVCNPLNSFNLPGENRNDESVGYEFPSANTACSRVKAVLAKSTDLLKPTNTEGDSMTDEQVFELFRAGDNNALTELYNRYKSGLIACLRNKMHCDSLTAEEIVQSTMIQVNRYKDIFEAGRLVRPWIYTIAHNISKNHMKQVSRRKKKERLFGDMPDNEAGVEADTIFSDPKSHEPIEACDNTELGQKAMQYLERLPPNLRTVAKLAVFNGLPSRAIGPLVNVTYRQAQNRLHTALGTLREQIEAECETEGHVEPQSAVCELIDALPPEAYEAIERVLSDEGSEEDTTFFASFVRKLAGEAA